jgi:type VI secretion system protein
MGPDSRHVFDTRGGSIGRAQESDWVLPDANRIVSNQHSIIEFRDGGFYLTDTSTNGVFLNNAGKPIGYNSAVVLREGDSIAIGEFNIRVEIESTDRFSTPIFRDDSAQSIDAILSEQSWPESENHEPLPLGLSEEKGLISDSRPSLPKEWDCADDGFSQLASQPDHTPAVNEAFSMPSSRVEQLPEDWDRDVVKAEARWAEEASSKMPPPAVDSGFQSSQQAHAMPDIAPNKSRQDTPVIAASQAFRSDSNFDSINEFLLGAGIDPAKVRTDKPKMTLEQLGKLYREMVQGVMDILIARSSLKNEFRMPHTIIRATENNPLKFSMGVDDALEYLLFKKSGGFLPADDAFREAYQDIKDHQFATVVGMQAAFNSLLRMFSPERLQSRFKNGNKRGGLLSFNKKSADWASYKEWYAALIDDTDDHFQQLFSGEFGRAYEEEIERLSAARRKSSS